jgi:acetyl-CoA C-acetyltransferase
LQRKTKKLGRGVAMIGAGMSKFGVFKGVNNRDLFIEAFNSSLKAVDKGIGTEDIEALYVGNYSADLFEQQTGPAEIIGDWLGLNPKPVTRIENMCASGGTAIREGIIAIASGLFDVVLVGGVEKMTNLSTDKVTDTLAYASDVYYEQPCGFTFPGLYAVIATAYLAKYKATPEHLMKVAIKNHNNGALNPKGQFNATILSIMNSRIEKAKKNGGKVPDWKTDMDFLHDPGANPVVAWPLRLFDCSPITDGAACIILAAEEVAKNFTDTPIYIIGTGQGSAPEIHDRPNMTSTGSANEASRQAYEMAGVTAKDIQIAEVHDCFTIAELMAIEDLGFFQQGAAAQAAWDGATARDGSKPINLSGGLKSKGHPIGATGAGQAVEMWHQLRGEAGPRQVPIKDLRLGLTHNIAATGGSCLVHIYERR